MLCAFWQIAFPMLAPSALGVPRHYRVRPRNCELFSHAGSKAMMCQMSFTSPLVLSTVAAVFLKRHVPWAKRYSSLQTQWYGSMNRQAFRCLATVHFARFE